MYEVSAGHEDIEALTVTNVSNLGAVYEPGELEALAELNGQEWAEVDAMIDAAEAEFIADFVAQLDTRCDELQALLDARQIHTAHDVELLDEVLAAFDVQIDGDDITEVAA